MKTKLKIIDVFTMNNRVIFDVEVIVGKYLIGDFFITKNEKFEFELKGVGLENNPDSTIKSFLVNVITPNVSAEDYKNKEFYLKK